MSGQQDGTFRGARGRPKLPLLDRLTDLDPDAVADRPLTAQAALDALRQSVRADLEALLNARRRWQSWDPRLRELATSPAGFGLPDFAAGAFNDPRRREELRTEIEACILRFEPRFARVTVLLLPVPVSGGQANGDDKLNASLRLRIEALLHADPAPEPITFDTLVDASTTDVTVLVQEG